MPLATPAIERLATVPPEVVRFVLAAVHEQPLLWREYVVKGSLVLAHVHGSPRPAHDFDFTALKPFSIDVTDEKNQVLLAFCDLLKTALARLAPAHGFGAVGIAEQTLSEEIPAFLGTIGLRPGAPDGAAGGAPERSRAFTHEVEIQVTLSEVVCETERAEIDGVPVHVPALDDLVAGKLKAFAQQVTRAKKRPNDVYDLWYVLHHAPRKPDPEAVTRYLLMKSANWKTLQPFTRARFRDPRIREGILPGWDAVLAELPPDAPRPATLDDGLDAVLALAEMLDLPEGSEG